MAWSIFHLVINRVHHGLSSVAPYLAKSTKKWIFEGAGAHYSCDNVEKCEAPALNSL